jgi:hypothetical protein
VRISAGGDADDLADCLAQARAALASGEPAARLAALRGC